MAVSLTSIETIVRYLLGDTFTSVIDNFTYNTSLVFTLSESNTVTITSVSVNDAVTSNYSYSSITNKVTLIDTLTYGDIVEIKYTCYRNYSSTEIQNYIQAVLPYFSIFQYKNFQVIGSDIYPEPSIEEKNCIAVATAIYIEPNNEDITMPSLKIKVANKKSTTDLLREIIMEFKSGLGIYEFISKGIIT